MKWRLTRVWKKEFFEMIFTVVCIQLLHAFYSLVNKFMQSLTSPVTILYRHLKNNDDTFPVLILVTSHKVCRVEF